MRGCLTTFLNPFLGSCLSSWPITSDLSLFLFEGTRHEFWSRLTKIYGVFGVTSSNVKFSRIYFSISVSSTFSLFFCFLRSLIIFCNLMKYFCACDLTCEQTLLSIKFSIYFQFLPNLNNPNIKQCAYQLKSDDVNLHPICLRPSHRCRA